MKHFPKDLSAQTLRFLAMGFMLLDHMWATVIPGNDWMTWIGRLAFPIFAFLLAEGYRRTRNFRKYLGRMALFALISELPFNLMATTLWIYPFYQNVLWTFCLALLCMRAMDLLKEKLPAYFAWPMMAVTAGGFYLLGELLMTDYGGWGVLSAVVFHLCPGRNWPERLVQLLCLYLINWEFLSGLTVSVPLLGLTLQIPRQGMAVLALPVIWLYRGRQGLYTKPIKWLGYWFYPVHALILGLISM